LQRCFAHSSGEIIFLTDADCILSDQVFERTLEPVINQEAMASTGSWRPLDRQVGQPFVQYQWTHHVYRELWMPLYAPSLDGRNAAVRREALEQIDAFQVEAPTGTDYVLSRQLLQDGHRIRFVRGSQVQTEYPATLGDYLRQISRWFRTPLIVARRWDDPELANSTLRAGIYSLGMLVLGGAGIFNKTARYTWLAALSHLAFSQARYSGLFQERYGDGTKGILGFIRQVLFLPFGWIAMANGLFDSLLPAKRRHW